MRPFEKDCQKLYVIQKRMSAAVTSLEMSTERKSWGEKRDHTDVFCLCPLVVGLVFPIRGKILKPGFRVAEKRNPGNPFFSGFDTNEILSDKNSISL